MTFIPLPPIPALPTRKADWTRVAARFDRFLTNIALTKAQFQDGQTKHHGVRNALNSAYWKASSNTANSMLIGSWGKGTQIGPPRDVDVLFQLPYPVYTRLEQRVGNKQSQLLQEVKGVLQRTYPNTDMSGDGQVVVVPFGSYGVEVVPAFLLKGGGYWVCDTNDNGKYRRMEPVAEHADINATDRATNGNLRRLVRMLKRWQDFCNVPMESFWLECLAAEFLRRWEFRAETSYFHDWMVNDFFTFLLGHGGGWVRLANIDVQHELGWLWYSRAKSASERAKKAAELESKGRYYAAGDEWRKIFGPDFQSL